MRRDYVDFFVVKPEHIAIHERLLNWGAWHWSSSGQQVSPMFRLYRSTEQWARPAISRVDAIDAQRIQRAVVSLPEIPRAALGWHYVKRSSPAKAAKQLGVNPRGLMDLVDQGRDLLIARMP